MQPCCEYESCTRCESHTDAIQHQGHIEDGKAVSCGEECDTVIMHPCSDNTKYGYGTKEMMDDIIITVAKTQKEKAINECIAVVEKVYDETGGCDFDCSKDILFQLQALRDKK